MYCQLSCWFTLLFCTAPKLGKWKIQNWWNYFLNSTNMKKARPNMFMKWLRVWQIKTILIKILWRPRFNLQHWRNYIKVNIKTVSFLENLYFIWPPGEHCGQKIYAPWAGSADLECIADWVVGSLHCFALHQNWANRKFKIGETISWTAKIWKK